MSLRVNDSRDYDDWNLVGFARPTGSSDPAFSNINGSGIYNWVYTNGKELHFPGAQMPHAYKESILVPHIHWCPTTTATYTGCVLAGLDAHILKDSLGSDSINTKSAI